MSDLNCAVCGNTCVEAERACRECHASPEWQDLFLAIRVANEQCADLHGHGLLSETELQHANAMLGSMQLQWSEQARQEMKLPTDRGLKPPFQCRQCDRPAGEAQKFCATCGGPTGARVDRLRHMDFVLNLITTHMAGEMTADNAQRCIAELHARIATIEAELKAEAAPQPAGEVVASQTAARRNLVEILLDPQSIRWLLASGGVLLAVGLVIFLSSLGVFKNAMVVASAIGLGTLSVLAGGIAMIRYTRHSLAGRALALLGCLVMPLNLWFYNANHLVTLDGHLWVAAMVCCALYAAAALVLEDPMFVYVLFGGITMTGMLVLADLHRLVEISAPATLLVALGLVSLHTERAFADNDGPFSRKRFGLACFWSAHALIGLGLLLLLGSQVAGWAPRFGLELNNVTALTSNQYLSLALLLAGGYGYLYSSLVVRRSRFCGYVAVICLLWAELLGIQIGHFTNHIAVLVSTLALTSLAMNIAASRLSGDAKDQRKSLVGALASLGVGLIAIALVMGVLPHLGTTLSGVIGISNFSVTWNYVGAMALTALCGQIAAQLNSRSRERLGATYLFAAAGAIFIGAASVLPLIGLHTWPVEATVLMVLPMIYLLASRFHTGGLAKRSLTIIAGVAAVVLTFSTLIVDKSQWLNPSLGQATDLWLAAFALEAAGYFAFAAASRCGTSNVYLSAAMVCGMIYQLLGFREVPLHSYSIAIAVAGVAGLIGHGVVKSEIRSTNRTAKALLNSANGLVSLPMAGMLLITLSQLAIGHIDLSMLWTPAILSLLALIAAALVSAGGARRWYFSLMIGRVAVSLLTLTRYSTLSLPRKFEAFSVIAGLGLLVIGYGLWYREQDGKNEGAGFCLVFGALMAGLPPALFAIINRFGYEVSFVDELALMTIAVLMFLTGMMSRVRATTLIGGGLLTCHLITLVVFAGMKAQLAVGAYVAISGAALFIIGLMLSVYRDRLLAMPQRIKHRQGLFRVLAWR